MVHRKEKGENMKKMVQLAHDFLKEYTKPNAICADFTMGNGHDTLLLCQLAKNGHVYAFDTQESAITKTKQRLQEAGYEHVSLIHDTHAHLNKYIKEPFDIGIFNFGYLPNDNHHVTTTLTETAPAIQSAFQQLRHHGYLILVVYPGHAEGKKEAMYIQQWCEAQLVEQASILQIQMIQKQSAPKLYLIEKLIG